LLLEAAASAGLYGLMVRTSGPQIRGGEAAALLRLGHGPLESLDDRFDLLLAIDWLNVHRFADEIALHPDGLVIGGAEGEPVPPVFLASGARAVSLPLKKMAKAVPGSWINMLALGITGALAGLAVDSLEAALRSGWKRSEAALDANLQALRAGMQAASDITGFPRLSEPRAATRPHAGRWLLTGNEAAGFGAIRGGVRFCRRLPRSRRPPSCSNGWRPSAGTRSGGTLLQAEDELASINMIVGASYGGVPSLTATSGPGLSLMTEAIGLAVAAEVPMVVVDVMRGGPSTGIPAKSEQSDLSFRDPVACTATRPGWWWRPTSIGDCLATPRNGRCIWPRRCRHRPSCCRTSSWASRAPSSTARCGLPAATPEAATYRHAEGPHSRPTTSATATRQSGVSPMAIPGTAGHHDLHRRRPGALPSAASAQQPGARPPCCSSTSASAS
jgi:2-oxoglutarate ferredoxin oxidoreductase subunit alpha